MLICTHLHLFLFVVITLEMTMIATNTSGSTIVRQVPRRILPDRMRRLFLDQHEGALCDGQDLQCPPVSLKCVFSWREYARSYPNWSKQCTKALAKTKIGGLAYN